MNSFRWVVLALGVGLIVVNGFLPDVFKINAFTISILFILSIPILAPYLKKAKFPGAEFVFKDKIQETKELVQELAKQAEKAKIADEMKISPFDRFRLRAVREQFYTDHVLALAALRIEIERKLRLLIGSLDIAKRDTWSISRIIDALKKNEVLSSEKISALQKIVNMCNKAVHGEPVSKGEANQIMDLADELYKYFSPGYSQKTIPK